MLSSFELYPRWVPLIIPRFITHEPQVARLKCNIPCSISNKPKQARFKCDFPRL